MITQITIEELYERCEVLIDEESSSNFIQMYDDPMIENDLGGIVTELLPGTLVDILEDGTVIIEGTSYTPYNYVQVSREILIEP